MAHHCLLTKYECARALGVRALELQEGAEPVDGTIESFVARELLDGRNRYMIRRTMPDGSFRDIEIRSLVIPDELREQLQYMIECEGMRPA